MIKQKPKSERLVKWIVEVFFIHMDNVWSIKNHILEYGVEDFLLGKKKNMI